jgi:hypothetical protein
MVDLSPGKAVTVEIKSRRVIEYLVPPLLRYKSESLRERRVVFSACDTQTPSGCYFLRLQLFTCALVKE